MERNLRNVNLAVDFCLTMMYIKLSNEETIMNTFNIQISETQLNLIKNALQKDSTYSESEEFIIGMIEDTIESKDSETTHGFCY